MFCKFCGHPIEDDALFCSKCGKALGNSNPIQNNFDNYPNQNTVALDEDFFEFDESVFAKSSILNSDKTDFDTDQGTVLLDDGGFNPYETTVLDETAFDSGQSAFSSGENVFYSEQDTVVLNENMNPISSDDEGTTVLDDVSFPDNNISADSEDTVVLAESEDVKAENLSPSDTSKDKKGSRKTAVQIVIFALLLLLLIFGIIFGIRFIRCNSLEDEANSYENRNVNLGFSFDGGEYVYKYGSKLGAYADAHKELFGDEKVKPFEETFFADDEIYVQNISPNPRKAKDCYITSIYTDDESVSFYDDDYKLMDFAVGDSISDAFEVLGKPDEKPLYDVWNLRFDGFVVSYGRGGNKYCLDIFADTSGKIISIDLSFNYSDCWYDSEDYYEAVYTLPDKRQFLVLGGDLNKFYPADLTQNSITDIYIKDGTKIIPEFIFDEEYDDEWNPVTSYFKKVKNVYIPASVTEIGAEALPWNSLKNVYVYSKNCSFDTKYEEHEDGSYSWYYCLGNNKKSIINLYCYKKSSTDTYYKNIKKWAYDREVYKIHYFK